MCNISSPPLLTYPARPKNGGRFDLAIKANAYNDPEHWRVEPKYNGWRALVHVRSGFLFNRHGYPLSISPDPSVLSAIQGMPFEWLDIELLRNRHAVGKGTVIVLDWPVTEASYESRRDFLGMLFDVLSIHDEPSGIHLPPSYPMTEGIAINEELKVLNARFGCTFYEGLVAKHIHSLYPIQTRSADEEFNGWVKHRFTTS